MLMIRCMLALTLSGVYAQSFITKRTRLVSIGALPAWEGSEYTYISSENTVRITITDACPNGDSFNLLKKPGGQPQNGFIGWLQDVKTGLCLGPDANNFLIRMDCSQSTFFIGLSSIGGGVGTTTVAPRNMCITRKDGRYALADSRAPNISCIESSIRFAGQPLGGPYRLGIPDSGKKGVDECLIISPDGSLVQTFDSSAQCFNTSQRAIFTLATPEGKLQYLETSGSRRCLNETAPDRVLKGMDCNQATTLFKRVDLNFGTGRSPAIIIELADNKTTLLQRNSEIRVGVAPQTPFSLGPPGKVNAPLAEVFPTSDPSVFCLSK